MRGVPYNALSPVSRFVLNRWRRWCGYPAIMIQKHTCFLNQSCANCARLTGHILFYYVANLDEAQRDFAMKPQHLKLVLSTRFC